MDISFDSKYQYLGINPQLTPQQTVQPTQLPVKQNGGIEAVQAFQPRFLSLTSYGFGEDAEKIYVGNTDMSLSYLRGELAVNIPLGADAVNVDGGYAGASLNVVM